LEKASLLGKKVLFPNKYDKELLIPLERKSQRDQAKIDWKEHQFFGLDNWTCYEVSWLNKRNFPQIRVLYLSYSSSSKFFIESKSLKLYLGSLHNERFSSPEEVELLIKDDLTEVIEEEVQIELLEKPKKILNCKTPLDELIIEINHLKEVDASILKSKNNTVSKSLHTSSFRSLCPVTSQPDWADIFIEYEGKEISEESLLKYLISYREHQGFHEECVERIFIDILNQCSCTSLTVKANFLRRGGIEINPIRSTIRSDYEVFRTERQ